jgi:hypothetical protein
MALTTECPFCHDLLGENDFLPGSGAICPRCKQPVPLTALIRPAAAGVRKAGPKLPVRPTPPTDQDRDADDETDDEEGEFEVHDPRTGWTWPTIDLMTAAAFLAGCAAILFAAIPNLIFLAKPLGLLGLLVGLVGSAAPPLRKRPPLRKPSHVGFPLGASAFCLFVLLFVGNQPRVEPPLPFAAIPLSDKGMTAHKAIMEDDWVDASASAVRHHDLRIDVVSVTIGGVEVEDQGKTTLTPEKHLVIRVRASYETPRYTRIPYEPWVDKGGSPSKHPPILTDTAKHSYAQDTFAPNLTIVGRDKSFFITPGHQVKEVLIFPAPTELPEFLHLELPADAFGMKGVIRFHIPKSMIQVSKPETLP